MRKILFLILAVCLSMAAFAQVPMVTLDHNDTITVFYGDQAFRIACDSAKNGDIITLSEGMFDGVAYIRKNNLTIRGAGMFDDTLVGTTPTILQAWTVFYDGASNCTFEGIHFNGAVHLDSSSNCLFRKCRFSSIENGYGNTPFGHNFYSCVIHYIQIYGREHHDYHSGNMENCNFYNCIIAGDDCNTCTSLSSEDAITLGLHNKMINCYLQFGSPGEASNRAEFYNCILYATYGGETTNFESHNCIGIKNYGNELFFDTSNAYNAANNQISMRLSDVFVNFNGIYHSGVDNLELTPAAQAILGFDGTEIGIHGGTYPYNPRLDTVTPIIGHISVPRISNAQGQLEMNVEIIHEQ